MAALVKKYVPYGAMVAALLFGSSGLVAFFAFLFTGSLHIPDMGLADRELLWFDAGISMLFFLQHSLLVRRSFRRSISQLIPDAYYGAFYAIISGALLLSVLLVWQESTWHVVTITGPYRFVLRLLYVVCVAGVIWGGTSLRYFDPFGRIRLQHYVQNREPKQQPFVVKGPYRLVRHPFYFFIVVMIWVYPDLTADRLLFNVLWTCWIVIGTVLEERDLVYEFGDRYKAYQKRVPMLVPFTNV